jgi:hypothetical protein
MLERIAASRGVSLKLRAEKEPDFDREVALVWLAHEKPPRPGVCRR